MYNRVSQFINILNGMIGCAVGLNWSCFNQKLDDMRGWWNGMLDDINDAIDDAVKALRKYTNEWFNWLDDWYYRVTDELGDIWDEIVKKFNQATQYAYDIVNGVYGWAAQEFNDVLAKIGTLDDWFRDVYYAWIVPTFNTVFENISTLWNFVFGALQWWANWLAGVQSVVEWLLWTGWTVINQFLSDPLGFIFGLWKDAVEYWLEFADYYGGAVYAFVTEVMTDTYNFWKKHGDTLWEFFTEPTQFILDRIAEPFVDWACERVAEDW